jgi:hypothetical protein
MTLSTDRYLQEQKVPLHNAWFLGFGSLIPVAHLFLTVDDVCVWHHPLCVLRSTPTASTMSITKVPGRSPVSCCWWSVACPPML